MKNLFFYNKGGPREDNEDEDVEGDDNDQAGDLEGK